MYSRTERAAARALATENARLQSAFDLSPRSSSDSRSGQLNRSLAYWVFETTLAYEIFKAWLPLADVDWEVSYPTNPGKKADLVVYEHDKPSIVVECKWWMNSQSKTESSLHDDAAKLLSWTDENVRHILLTFWHSPDADELKDWKDVADFCASRGGKPYTCDLLWNASFPIHHHLSPRHHFVLAAIEVVPSTDDLR